jgi:hypothetical protein
MQTLVGPALGDFCVYQDDDDTDPIVGRVNESRGSSFWINRASRGQGLEVWLSDRNYTIVPVDVMVQFRNRFFAAVTELIDAGEAVDPDLSDQQQLLPFGGLPLPLASPLPYGADVLNTLFYRLADLLSPAERIAAEWSLFGLYRPR